MERVPTEKSTFFLSVCYCVWPQGPLKVKRRSDSRESWAFVSGGERWNGEWQLKRERSAGKTCVVLDYKLQRSFVRRLKDFQSQGWIFSRYRHCDILGRFQSETSPCFNSMTNIAREKLRKKWLMADTYNKNLSLSVAKTSTFRGHINEALSPQI